MLLSVEVYFDFAEKALEKQEFHNGVIREMPGSDYEHSLIAANIGGEIANRLHGSKCRTLDSNMRISVVPGSCYVYPDITIVCGEPQFDALDKPARSLLNPKAIFEVISKSTEAYDRGDKFAKYREISTLQEYVLVSQFGPQIEVFSRREDGSWLFSFWTGMDAAAKLSALGIELPLQEVYADVTFPTRPEAIDRPPT